MTGLHAHGRIRRTPGPLEAEAARAAVQAPGRSIGLAVSGAGWAYDHSAGHHPVRETGRIANAAISISWLDQNAPDTLRAWVAWRGEIAAYRRGIQWPADFQRLPDTRLPGGRHPAALHASGWSLRAGICHHLAAAAAAGTAGLRPGARRRRDGAGWWRTRKRCAACWPGDCSAPAGNHSAARQRFLQQLAGSRRPRQRRATLSYGM